LAIAGWEVYAAAGLTDEQQIAKIEKDWSDAIKNRDPTSLEKYLAKDFTYTDENGKFDQDRDAYLKDVMSQTKIVKIDMSNGMVRVHENTGVATGALKYTDINGGTGTTRYTDTYIKGEDGVWRAMASQETNAKW